MNFDINNLVEITPEENERLKALSEKLGSTTAWEMFQNYGINRQKIYRAIHKGKLTAFMKSEPDKKGIQELVLKWYIVKDELYEDFIKACSER